MNDTRLHFRLWKNTQDGLLKTIEIINAGNQNILYASVLKIGKYTEPKVGTFTFRYIDAQQILPPLLVDTQYIVDGSVLHLPVILYFIVHGIKPNNAIKLL